MKPATTATQERLNEVNRYLGRSVQWQPLNVAIDQHYTPTNTLFQATVDENPLILRINADEALAFGVCRHREAEILNHIQTYPWAPTILKNDWQGGWCLMKHHGSSSSSAKQQLDSRSHLLSAVHQWQTIALDNACHFDYPSLFQRYRAVFLATPESTKYLNLLDEMCLRINGLPTVPRCLTHHDLHPGNLCVDGEKQVVLDWEYAGVGNPWFDAAALVSRFGLSIEQLSRLPAFTHLSAQQLQLGLREATWLANALEQLWYAARGQGLGARS